MPASAPLPVIDAALTAGEVCALLAHAGWREIARGDWSWALLAPDGARVARVTPWDAAYRLHAALCVRHASHPHLPRVDRISPLAGDGYVTFLEALTPCPDGEGEAFCAALDLGDDTEDRAPREVTARAHALASRADVQSLRALLAALIAEGARTLPFWGGSDIRPGNLMCDAAGIIKIIDPVFVRGRAIVQAIVDGDAPALRAIARRNLEAFLTIPVFLPGPDTDKLRARLAEIY